MRVEKHWRNQTLENRMKCLGIKTVRATSRNFLSRKFEQKWQGMESNQNEGKVVAFIGKNA